MLKAKPGIVYAELLSQRDGDAYTYMIECEVGIDIRKPLFYTLAEKKWPLIGMEALGMSLEDIFITIVDQTSAKSRYERKKKSTGKRNEAEIEVAKKMANKQSILEAPEHEADEKTETAAETETKTEAEKKYSALFGDGEENK
jgi:ABC-2 type transport system ATP-binding protein